jgi:hypothetical protein
MAGMDALSHPFIKAMLDPQMIAGVYNTCDQWCTYCPVTARCLAFRCSPRSSDDGQRPDIYMNIANQLYESMQQFQAEQPMDLQQAEQLNAMLADDVRKTVKYEPLDDPLEKMGKRYAIACHRHLASHQDRPNPLTRRDDGPRPLEVIAWYHILIASKIYRAILSSSKSARGEANLREDALFSAKVALIGIDRSRAAFQELSAVDDDARVKDLQAQLRRLSREVAARFPEARTTIRPGLDVPAS